MTSENIENIKKYLKLQEEPLEEKNDITAENVGLGSKLQT